MKAGFVITNSKIKLPEYKDWILNQGKESEITDEKYIFRKFDDNTDFFKIADRIRSERLKYFDDGKTFAEPLTVHKVIEKPLYAELPIPEKTKSLKDIGLLMCAFCVDGEIRIDAISKGIRQLKRLNPMPKIVFYEAGDKPKLKHLFDKNDTYKFIKTTKKNEMLWQKEALFNIMAKENNFKYYIFHDADIYPDREDWALWIKNYLSYNDVVIQGGYIISDTVDLNRNKTTYGYEITTTKDPVIASPGGCVALSKNLFNKLGGWAVFLIAGSGDGAAISKWAKKFQYKNQLAEFCEWWKLEAERDRVAIADYSFAPFKMIHYYHGDYDKRGYFWRNITLGWAGIRDIRDVVKLGKNGLIEWKKPRPDLVYILRNRCNLKNRDASFVIYKEAMLQ